MRYFIELQYKGTNFHGWQVQPNAISVQEMLNKALSIIFRENIDTVGCGRTDTGVHADNFFAHFDTEKIISFENESKNPLSHNRLVKAVNALVGYDIAVKQFIAVTDDAHARFNAISRSYRYVISKNKNPFLRDFSLLLEDSLDIDKMNLAAEKIMQYQDFSCFSKSNTQTFTNNCKITEAKWTIKDDQLVFNITADRFLRNMVRAIVGTLISVGKSEISINDIDDIILSKSRSKAGESVSAAGLFLTKIIYPENIFIPKNIHNGEFKNS